VVTQKAKTKDEVVATHDSGSQEASGTQPGGDKTVEHGSAVVPDTGSDKGSAEVKNEGSAKVEPPPPPPPKTTAKVTLETTPAGAEIYINGIPVVVDGKPVHTPTSFELPISTTAVRLTLHRDGYEDIEDKSFVVSEDFKKSFPEFKRKRSSSSSNKDKGKGSSSGNKGSSSGTSGTSNDTGIMRPD
jgi:hypothetical protein